MATPSRAPCSAAICRRNACRGDRRAGQGGEGGRGGHGHSARKEDAQRVQRGCSGVEHGRSMSDPYGFAGRGVSRSCGVARSQPGTCWPRSPRVPRPASHRLGRPCRRPTRRRTRSPPLPCQVRPASAPPQPRALCVVCFVRGRYPPTARSIHSAVNDQPPPPPPRHGPLRARGQGPRRHGRGALGARGRHRPSSRSSLSMYCST